MTRMVRTIVLRMEYDDKDLAAKQFWHYDKILQEAFAGKIIHYDEKQLPNNVTFMKLRETAPVQADIEKQMIEAFHINQESQT